MFLYYIYLLLDLFNLFSFVWSCFCRFLSLLGLQTNCVHGSVGKHDSLRCTSVVILVQVVSGGLMSCPEAQIKHVYHHSLFVLREV